MAIRNTDQLDARKETPKETLRKTTVRKLRIESLEMRRLLSASPSSATYETAEPAAYVDVTQITPEGEYVAPSADDTAEIDALNEQIAVLEQQIAKLGIDARTGENLLGSFSRSFTRTSGNAVIKDDGITFTDRSYVVSEALPVRQSGDVYETRISLTFSSSDDTHLYLNNDTKEYNYETGHGVNIIPKSSTDNIGVCVNANGRILQNIAQTATLPNGDYTITMTDTDETHTTVITLPNGSKRTFTQDQRAWENSGRIFLNAGGMTVRNLTVQRLTGATLGEQLEAITSQRDTLVQVMTASKPVAQEADAIFGDPQLLDDTLAEADSTEAVVSDVAAATIRSESPAFDPLPAAEEDSPEQRIDALHARQEVLQREIDTLTLQMEDLETRIARENATLEEADAMDAQAHDMHTLWDRQLGLDSQKVTPSIQVETFRLNPQILVSYRDMPAGNFLTLDERGAGWRFPVPAGSGDILANLPQFGWWGTTTLRMTDADGNVLRDVLVFNHTEANSPSKSGAVKGGGDVPQLAYVLEVPAALRVNASDMEHCAQMEAQAAAMREEASESLEELTQAHDALREQINALSRAQIPYSAMTMEPVGHAFRLAFMSNRPQTYVEALFEGEIVYRETIEHAGGTSNSEMVIDAMHLPIPPRRDPVAIDFRMRDAYEGEILDSVRGAYDGTHAQTAGGSNGDLSDLETGRIVENPIEPVLTIIRLDGPNVLVAWQSPHDGATLEFDGGGMLSHDHASHTGGSQLSASAVTFNADRPEGNYFLSLKEPRNNRIIDQLQFHWNPATKTLTPPESIPEITVPDDNALRDQLSALELKFLAQCGMTGSIAPSDPTVSRSLFENLYSHSRFFLDAGNEQAILDASPLKGDPTADSSFRNALATYEAAVSVSLRNGAIVAQKIIHGESESAALAEAQLGYNSTLTYTGWRDANWFGQTFVLPSFDALMDEGIRLFREESGMFIASNAKQVATTNRMGFIADREGPEHEIGHISTAAYNRTRALLESIYGAGSSQVVAYEGFYYTDQQETVVADGGGIVGSETEKILLASAGVNDGVLAEAGVFAGIYIPADAKETIDETSLRLAENATDEITFTLNEDKMVNLWVTGVDQRNVQLTIRGGGLGSTSYSSPAMEMNSGASISLHLTPGIYTLTVRDGTDYNQSRASGSFNARLQYKILDYTSADIQGMISTEGDAKVMPVSLKVAEFDGDHRKDSADVEKLNPNKPVWVVVHGREDRGNSDAINELAKNLQVFGMQVVTIDWEDAAGDNLTNIGLQGTHWITAVSTWATHQLQSLGFQGTDVQIVGHSWGADIAYEIGACFPGGVRTIVALDPAKDSAFLGSHYDESAVNFEAVSQHSYAFHSSIFGDENLALRAQYSFGIIAPENYENVIHDHESLLALLRGQIASAIGLEFVDEVVNDAYREHGFAVSLFSELLKEAHDNPNAAVASMFAPEHLRSSSAALQYNNNYEGVFMVNPYLTNDSDGANWWKATSYAFLGTRQDGSELSN